MASHWNNQNAAGSSNNNAGNYPNETTEMDLTLKLGLPIEAQNRTNTNTFNPLSMNVVNPNNYFSNMNFNTTPYQGASLYRPVGGYGMAGQPVNPSFGNNFPMNNEGRTDYGLNHQLYDRGNYQYSQNMTNPISGVENHFDMMNNGAGGSIMGGNFNPSGYNSTGTITFPSPPITNEYTLIDTPARRNRNVEIHDPFFDGTPTVAVDRRGVRRQRTGTYNEPNKRCSNFNCGTTETPMWRRGPLGPKTLCNACGIKYRKEEEKRKAKEASKSSD